MDRMAAMETYISVVEAGSFSAAAKRLKMGQPAVSKSVAQLEERLGVRLLLRSTRGLTATDAGQRFYEHAKRALEEVEAAEQVVRDSSTSLAGVLRVGMAVTFARLHILPSLKVFMARHPDLQIDVVMDDRTIDLLGQGIDVALRMGNLDDSTMTAKRLARSRRVVVGTPAYFAKTGVPKMPADLSQHQAIVYSLQGGGESWAFSQNGKEVAVVVGGRVSVSAAEGVRAVVLGDLGLAVASEWMFSDQLADGHVRTVLDDWELPAIDLWAVFPSGRLVSAKARAFIAFVEEIMGAGIDTSTHHSSESQLAD
ncbi:transcriptional regulator [Robbsia andropogonis]|uniref:Transcriptional regulator n=1 Tax=Robbsia andropogonis TaxID=28092 RepID=A0A0F5K3G0_9BURK|nr:LysR family transcriptional regulator [Robbsia andropogonis]KKB64651.1 transcriptional regulator [Robbsia andropogonis]MCP1117826.1 LysR substrate-binding domain-containing protein [Robbsia andropogonis]MCP1127290.1 LysR substrate-binding domain-containing protein [Robbsia andropogonis]